MAEQSFKIYKDTAEQYNELMDVGKEETDPEGKLIN